MVSTQSIEGQATIVTGASAGIGQATAHALAREGARVAIAARRRERLADLAETLRTEYDAEVLVVPTDLRDESSAEALVETTVEEFGGLDLLVNNAGLARGGDVADLPTEDYRTMMETNVDGCFFTSRAALPSLIDASGTLVFVGSFAGQYPRPSNPVYAASKWWVRGFAKSLSAQVGDEDVAVTVVNPTEVRTEFGAAYGETFAERFEEGEVSEPEEIAEAVVFAARQHPSMASEIDIYRRDKFTGF